jgi:DinB superfamily
MPWRRCADCRSMRNDALCLARANHEGSEIMKETPQEYTKRILAKVKGLDPLKVEARTAKKLENLIKGVPTSKLRKRPAPKKWSVAEILAHLADSEIARSWRIRQILGAPRNVDSGLRSKRLGRRRPLRKTRPKEVPRSVSGIARSKPCLTEIVVTRAVEISRRPR